MKKNYSVLLTLLLLVLSASLYRVWEGRPAGFAPQLSMALFGGAVITNKRLAFILPLLSMLISDAIYQVLYVNGYSAIPGFYEGQIANYALFAGLTVFGFFLKSRKPLKIAAFTITGSVLFFLTSNFLVWLGGGGFKRPKTVEGLLQCYGDGLAFFRDHGAIPGFWGNFILGDLFFAALLFTAYALLHKPAAEKQLAA